ncbi:MAG: 8-oxo-dGTP pyrophosphatase MutT (NUDIX family) [Gammaproteobacteria bacterium]|jgi:8-oxo-dGTP pyrophosphatase MutT (NUDIX family)
MSITRAKDAASIIIYRGRVGAIEVLMGRRRSRASFAPSMYVFPGGALESSDSKVTTALPFNTQGLPRGATHRIHELTHTAIRETYEETGLLLGQKGEFAKVNNPTWVHFHQMGVVPAPHRLAYLGRAITPVESAKRFHARFFVTAFKHFSGSLIDNGELLEFMLEEMKRFLHGERKTTPLMYYRRNRTQIRYE